MSLWKVCLAFAALFFLAMTNGLAATYWVATTGNNSNPGTQALPFLTVGKAASIAQGSDTVIVNPGTYLENVTPAHSGDQGTNITYVGRGYPTVGSFAMTGLSNWRIVGFHFYPITTNINVTVSPALTSTNALTTRFWTITLTH